MQNENAVPIRLRQVCLMKKTRAQWCIRLVMMLLSALSILHLQKALAASESVEIVAVDLLTVREPRSRAESRLRGIRLTTRSCATGYGDCLDFGLPAENDEETLPRLVNHFGSHRALSIRWSRALLKSLSDFQPAPRKRVVESGGCSIAPPMAVPSTTASQFPTITSWKCVTIRDATCGLPKSNSTPRPTVPTSSVITARPFSMLVNPIPLISPVPIRE